MRAAASPAPTRRTSGAGPRWAGGTLGTMAPTSLHGPLVRWYDACRRDLPWRAAGIGPWGVLVSEFMLQQTPVRRVEPVWRAWLARWPTAADLATATPADAVRAWDRLGYPRRALRLLACAREITERHGGRVPSTLPGLTALPGVGDYTAAAVLAFGYGGRAVVLDTNVRRVLARLLGGEALPPPGVTRGERARAEAALPPSPAASAAWNVALMELGALVCTARAPRCAECPMATACAWRAAGCPPDPYLARRRSQSWTGSDRQARGRLLAVLRSAGQAGASGEELAAAWDVPDQRDRALASLVADGLAEAVGAGYRLPEAVISPLG